MNVFGWLENFFVNMNSLAIDVETEPWMYDSLRNAEWYHALDGSDHILVFPKGTFAPGVWVGTEGWTFAHDGNRYKITKVDLENHALSVETI